jgi:DNA-binding FrmR family transcriptional regulator
VTPFRNPPGGYVGDGSITPWGVIESPGRQRLPGRLETLTGKRRTPMQLEPDEIKAVITRLKRANGHLASVIRMLEEGSECEDALTQLAAVNKAVSRGGYALVATGLEKCLAEGGRDSVDTKKMEKLFLALA